MQRLEAIILAGGSGARFGGGKLFSPYRGGALIDGAVRAALSAPIDRAILVTGCGADEVAAAARALVAREYADQTLDIVHADRHRDGLASTLKAGIAAISGEVDGAFVFLADMPRIPPGVARALADGIGDRSAAAPLFRGERGHPVLFAARLFPDLLKLSGERGAGPLLTSLGEDVALVPVDDPGVLFDVDVRADALV